MSETEGGLEPRYEVKKNNDPTGKHDDCQYFVLDPQHDPIAVDALRAYATGAGATGFWALRNDLHSWLDRLAPAPAGDAGGE